MISLTVEDVLPPKSLWNASILAYGCETHTAVTELSETLIKKSLNMVHAPILNLRHT